MEDKCIYENGWPVLGMMKNCGQTCCGNPTKNPDRKFDTLRNLCQTCEETKEGRLFCCLQNIVLGAMKSDNDYKRHSLVSPKSMQHENLKKLILKLLRKMKLQKFRRLMQK